MLGRGEQVAFVVVASPVGQYQVLDGVDAAADPRDEVIGLWRGAEGPAAVKALAALKGGDTVSHCLRRDDPVRSEQMTVQVQFDGGHLLADVLEVLRALTVTAGMSWPQLLALAEDKRSRRGGFRRRIFLESVE
jgi:hypothetical protein